MHPVIAAQPYKQGTAKSVRQEGKVPAVMYSEGKETSNIAIDMQEFRRAFRTAGKATLVEIDFEGKKTPALIHVIDTHPVSGDPVHIDFFAVNMNKEVNAVVPVKFKGVSDAVKLLGGTLTVMHDRIQINCLPKHLISSIDADLSVLKTFHDHINVSDLPFPAEITVTDDADTMVASVAAPRKAVEETADEEMGEGGEEGEAGGKEKTEA